MDDSPAAGHTPDRELAQLRARAYGPHADIHRDPAAQARLAELEQRGRAPAREDGDGIDAAATPAPEQDAAAPEQETPAPKQDAPAPVEVAAPEASSGADDELPPVRERRTTTVGRVIRRGWPFAAAGVAVLLLAGVGISALVAPRPDAVLHAGDPSGVSVPRWEGSTSPIPGRELEDLESYGSHRGIGVWGADAQDGSSCIFAAWSREQWTVACAPPPLQPVLDLQIYDGMAMPAAMGELPQGSVLRFTRVGETIEVWEAVLDVEA